MTRALPGLLARSAGIVALGTAMATVSLPLQLAALASAAIVVVPIVGLAAAAWGVPFAGAAPLPVSAGALTATPLVLGWTAVVWLLAGLAAGRFPSLEIPLLRPLAVFVAALLLAAWRAPDWLASGFEIARWLELGLALVLTASLVRTPRALRIVLLALLLAGVAEALVGLRMARAGIGPEAFAILGGRLFRAHGTFGQPNPFGAYMNMVWPVGAALALGWLVPTRPAERERMRGGSGSGGSGSGGGGGGGGEGAGGTGTEAEGRTLPVWLAATGAVVALVCGLGLVLSWSRGAWLAAAAGAGALTAVWLGSMLRPHARGRALAAIWMAVALALLLPVVGATDRVPASVVGRLGSIGETFTLWGVADAEVDDASFATIERVAHWEAAAAMWADAPWLGQGPGHYEIAYADYRLPRWSEPLGHAHNYYLHVLAEGGLVGLAGYVVFLGACVVFAVRAALGPRSALHRALGLGLVGVLVTVAAHSLVDNVFVHETTIHLGLLLGLTVAAEATA